MRLEDMRIRLDNAKLARKHLGTNYPELSAIKLCLDTTIADLEEAIQRREVWEKISANMESGPITPVRDTHHDLKVVTIAGMVSRWMSPSTGDAGRKLLVKTAVSLYEEVEQELSERR